MIVQLVVALDSMQNASLASIVTPGHRSVNSTRTLLTTSQRPQAIRSEAYPYPRARRPWPPRRNPTPPLPGSVPSRAAAARRLSARPRSMADEQSNPKLLFELMEMPAEGRLRDVEALCGFRDAQRIRHGDERADVTKVHGAEPIPDLLSRGSARGPLVIPGRRRAAVSNAALRMTLLRAAAGRDRPRSVARLPERCDPFSATSSGTTGVVMGKPEPRCCLLIDVPPEHVHSEGRTIHPADPLTRPPARAALPPLARASRPTAPGGPLSEQPRLRLISQWDPPVKCPTPPGDWRRRAA